MCATTILSRLLLNEIDFPRSSELPFQQRNFA